MSRIGKKPIVIPEHTTLAVADRSVTAKGAKGELSLLLHPDMTIAIENNEARIVPRVENKNSAALWGLYRSLVANIVEGVTKGFEKKLELDGIGYRVAMEGTGLLMQLGFSHPVRVAAPEGIQFQVERNVITVSGADKAKVGEVAARIRALKKPEPYKGKGIHYRGEVIRRKQGKKSGT
ncbi:MAG: 50S ribosomal protein L6 [Candidatus Sungbacteria bacterium]|nr:50S ribosomal protein L6 [Candidatus Sungbacteria bacterium]